MAKRFHESRSRKHDRSVVSEYERVRPYKREEDHAFHMRDREQYAGREETKMTMARDAHMIADDWNAPALLPQNVISRDWPRAASYNLGTMDDLFSGVQKQMSEDFSDLRKAEKPGKY